MDAFEAVSLPEPSSLVGKKFFSVPEANRALVLVRRIAGDIVKDYHELRDLHNRFQNSEPSSEWPGGEGARERYALLSDHLVALREELESLGCELKDHEVGLVDFPCLCEGREVYLCWKLGEEQIEHWHETDRGAAGRKPISTLGKSQ